jgi:DNA uptake protein ComE-like DNA-binding protein
MKKLLAGLALAFAATILLQKRWTGGQGRALPKPDGGKNRRGTGRKADAGGMQAGPEKTASRTEISAASGAARDTEGRRPQQSRTTTAGQSGEQILNSATRQQLLSVYGIGPVLADRIIQNRPYAAAYDVVEKGIIPESIFVQLRKQLLDQAQTSGPL